MRVYISEGNLANVRSDNIRVHRILRNSNHGHCTGLYHRKQPVNNNDTPTLERSNIYGISCKWCKNRISDTKCILFERELKDMDNLICKHFHPEDFDVVRREHGEDSERNL